MRLSIRHCAAALLAAGGLAVSYGLAESLVNGYQYWTALPIACLAGLVYVAIGERHSERQLQMALAGTAGLIVLLNLASGALVFSALAPVKTMCGCV
jgi:hypothetical protein